MIQKEGIVDQQLHVYCFNWGNFSSLFFCILPEFFFSLWAKINLERPTYLSSVILMFTVSLSVHGQVQDSLYFEQNKDFVNAIDRYSYVNTYARKSNNINLMFLSSYSIGMLNVKMNEYDEALKFLKKSLNYNLDRGREHLVLASILEISNVYLRIKNVDSLNVYISFGKALSVKLKDSMSYHHLSVHESIAEYQSGNMRSAILNLEKERRFYEKRNKLKCLIFPYFHLAKAYNLEEDTKTSIFYLKKVDSIFQLINAVYPVVRETYEQLIEHSKDVDNSKDQLFYESQLIRFDSIVNQNQPYVSQQEFKEYTMPTKKRVLETTQENEKNTFITLFILFVLFVVVFFICFFQFNRRKFYENRSDSVKVSSTNPLANSAVLPDEIVEEVLLKLHMFEQEKRYLTKSITLNSLAKEIHTNTNYLSKIINTYKESSFSNYLNTLRINFIVNELNVKNKYSKFTIQALAEEAGFNTSESFAKAFYKITNAKPSDYIRKLEDKL